MAMYEKGNIIIVLSQHSYEQYFYNRNTVNTEKWCNQNINCVSSVLQLKKTNILGECGECMYVTEWFV